MTDPMTPERLAEIEARANAATEGPWEAIEDDSIHAAPAYVDNGGCGVIAWRPVCDFVVRHGDAEFIAHARTDAPALLTEVRRLQAAVERVRAVHKPTPGPPSQHYYCEPEECDRAGEGDLCDECDDCGRWWPCPTIAALDGDE